MYIVLCSNGGNNGNDDVILCEIIYLIIGSNVYKYII